MSKIDIIKGAYQALANHDLEGTLEFMSADVEYRMPNIGGRIPYGGRAKGLAQVDELMDGVAELVTPSEFKPETFLESGSVVVVIGTEKVQVDATGKTFINEWVHVFHVTDGKITYVRESFDSLAFSKHLEG